ncbi:porin OmpA [Thorsellia anophelis]|uniref:Outer membrane protein A n=1 Tax=Thorsellia anophelis DSM 18579 TaxID=1123402 RepID=A0A1H9YV76_9GAMM|nr:porin OmpA [Thorsellia anophelis]SES73034.1 OmpA-OmpF porin, OOP family [Thorsellia anophelis DSM 18579]
MKLSHLTVGILLAGVSAASFAAPDVNTPYVGAKAGWSHYFDSDLENLQQGDRYDFSRNRFAAGGFAGYQFTPNIGLEVGYDWLGRSKVSVNGASGNTLVDGKYTAQGLYATGKFSYEVVNDLDLYTRLGVYGWRASAKVYEANGFYKDSLGRNTSNGVSPVFAGGVEYAITPSIATRLDYQYVPNMGKRSDTYLKPDNGLLSVGLSYRFGQGQVAPAPVAAPAAPKLETKTFNLRSDVLFAFGKAELKAEGRTALDQLFNELKRIDPDEGKAVVIGFTDRIGSAQANQALSERRAQTVVNYLTQIGVPANLIEARGMGANNPVTGTQCDNVSPRAALIECLAPDRRVEIQVSGLATVTAE